MGFNFHSFNSRTEWGIKKTHKKREGRRGEGGGGQCVATMESQALDPFCSAQGESG